jgi:hypothetical protein
MDQTPRPAYTATDAALAVVTVLAIVADTIAVVQPAWMPVPAAERAQLAQALTIIVSVSLATFGLHRAAKHGASVLAAAHVQAARIAATTWSAPVVGEPTSTGSSVSPPTTSAARHTSE